MVPLFIKTRDKNIWFAFNKNNDNYICFPKKVNNYKGKEYNEWFQKTFYELEKYKKKIEGLDETVFVVNEKDIIQKYDSLQFVKEKKYLKLDYDFDDSVKKIINAINNFFDIDVDDIGIEGSLLLGCYKKESDIDILVFGKENSKKIQKKFSEFYNYDGIKIFNEKQASKYVKKRKKCGYGNNLELLKKQFLRRYYGFVEDKQFSIVCVPYEFQEGYINLDRKIKYDSCFEGILTIINDDDSCMIPSTYYAEDNNGEEYCIEIYNHYGINQVKKGEKVFIKGKKYIDCSNNKLIIILSFWSNMEERFDLYE